MAQSGRELLAALDHLHRSITAEAAVRTARWREQISVVFQDSRTDRNTAELVEAMKPTSEKLAYEPGTDWRYSNTAYVLLGVLIEKLENQPYAEVMQRRLLAPLGLTHTAVDDAATVVPNRVSGYSSAPIRQARWKDGWAAPPMSATDRSC